MTVSGERRVVVSGGEGGVAPGVVSVGVSAGVAGGFAGGGLAVSGEGCGCIVCCWVSGVASFCTPVSAWA